MPRKLTQEEFIERAKAVHGDRYSYENTVYIKREEKVRIDCKKHGSYLKRPDAHLSGQGCPKCGTERGSKKLTHTKEMFIERAIEVHNNLYDYSEVNYKTARIKVKIFCKKCGTFFWQSPECHTRRKHGCPICSTSRSGYNSRNSTEDFIRKAKTIHNNFYNYSKTEYKTAKDKVEIVCPDHGSFFQIPYSHLIGKGCRVCQAKKLAMDRSSNIEEFKKRAYEIWGDKRDFSNSIYKNARTKMEIRCNIHNTTFMETPDSCLQGLPGCPECKKENISTMECFTEKFLKSNKIRYIPQATFDECKYISILKFDFYLPNHNLVIECQGEQHYHPVEFFGGHSRFIERNIRDMIKMNYCKQEGIGFLEIPYWDKDNIEEILTANISSHL